MRRLPAQDGAPGLALGARELDEQERDGEGHRGLLDGEGEDEEHDGKMRAAQIEKNRAQIKSGHQRDGAAADVGHGFGLRRVQREEQRRQERSIGKRRKDSSADEKQERRVERVQ